MFNGEEKAVNESSDPVRGKIPPTNELAVSLSGVMYVIILWYCGSLLTLSPSHISRLQIDVSWIFLGLTML